jgi:hypothetical protein
MIASGRASRAIATLAVLATTATVGVSAAGAANGYPESFEKAFLKSCKSGSAGGDVSKKEAKRYCKAVLKCIEKTTTYEKVANGSTKAITSCSQKHADKLS